MRERPGPKGAARHVSTSAETFNLFLPDTILDKILRRTNEEGERVARANGITHSTVSREELLAFLGLLILRGSECDVRCEIRELFYGPFSRPFYRATMTVNRFKHLLRIIRFDDRETRDGDAGREEKGRQVCSNQENLRRLQQSPPGSPQSFGVHHG